MTPLVAVVAHAAGAGCAVYWGIGQIAKDHLAHGRPPVLSPGELGIVTVAAFVWEALLVWGAVERLVGAVRDW